MATKWDLAVEFSRQLEQAIGSVALESAVMENILESDPNICHTHDRCDANQCMLDAADALGIAFDPQDERQMKLFNAAWDIAKECEFNEEEIRNTEALLHEGD